MHEDNLIFIDEFEVRLNRKRVKNVRMRVVPPDGHVEISMPARYPQVKVEEFVREHARWIRREQERLRTSPRTHAELASPQEIEQWRALCKAVVPLLVAKWEPVLGVHAGQLAYRNMRSRWGSCTPSTGRICINIRLALYPPECLEYVVVHELCHLLVAGHGPEFHALLDNYLPTWRKAVAKLRD